MVLGSSVVDVEGLCGVFSLILFPQGDLGG